MLTGIFVRFLLKKQQITVRVPATTSNLGPGFDCLGVALQLYNFVTVARASEIEAGGMARQAARQQGSPMPGQCTSGRHSERQEIGRAHV